MPADALVDEAAALYALRPDEFTAARNTRARELRDDDRELADAVGALKRPSPAAWLANQLVRHRGDEVEQLLELGEELRDAQDDLDAVSLARFAKERRRLVAALAQEAGGLADELGSPVRQPVLDELAQTLQAGMADAAAAEAVRSGRLVRGLEAVGVEVDLDGAVAGEPGDVEAASRRRTSSSSRSRRAGADAATEARERAEREQEERRERERAASAAEERAAEASAALDDLEHELSDIDDRMAADTERRDELDDELRELEERLAESGRERRRLARDRDRAARAAESARDEATAARDALD
ncbi:transposase [Agromyces endophyticus]|uniref:transposase n=1 Tax=Agromyces sp. H17E-10 TaxID=2932244 RepID=UPI001FD31791|nr:transposase [Agromyces sp. H17E-10]UOQ90079.1 transposase [Agromyces sp. H17E-10]